MVAETAVFEQKFSRFITSSESRALSDKTAGTYPISEQMLELLTSADHLRELTAGMYDPAVGGLLEAAGYNSAYRLKEDEERLRNWRLPIWTVDTQKSTVTTDSAVVFDFGGMGKGYWIDQVSKLLKKSGYTHHLVEGGGDMIATTKANGEGWQVAIEYPGKTDLALGTYVLKNQGLAASDVFRRKWGAWHHFLDVHQKQSTQYISGCVAVSSGAWKADQITSVLALIEPEKFAKTVAEIGGEYVVLLANGEARVSTNWHGELF